MIYFYVYLRLRFFYRTIFGDDQRRAVQSQRFIFIYVEQYYLHKVPAIEFFDFLTFDEYYILVIVHARKRVLFE